MIERIVSSVWEHPYRWISACFGLGFAGGWYWDRLVAFLKAFLLVTVLVGGGGMWAHAGHQERATSGLTSSQDFFCNDGSIITKDDYDLDGNGKDDYTTYTKAGEDHPYAELIGDGDGFFEKGIVHGEEFDSFGRLRYKYPTVCEALRQRK